MPTRQERGSFHGIALFYFLVGVIIGLPLWWYTTSPEQHALPTEQIAAIASQAITVGIDVSLKVYKFTVYKSCLSKHMLLMVLHNP